VTKPLPERLFYAAAAKFIKYVYVYTYITYIYYVYIYIYIYIYGDRGSTVVKVLRYKSEGRWVSIPGSVSDNPSHYGPGVDSASNRNEC